MPRYENEGYQWIKSKVVKGILNLAGIGLDDESTIQIAKYLSENTDVKSIVLDNNKISDKGAIALGEMLTTNKDLRYFSIADNPIGASGLKALANAITTNRILFRVVLSHLKGNLESNKAIIKIIKSNNFLKMLIIADIGLTKNDETDLADAIATNKSLLTLDISGNHRLQAGEPLGKALSINTVLLDLFVTGAIENKPKNIADFLNLFTGSDCVEYVRFGMLDFTSSQTATALENFLSNKRRSLIGLALTSSRFSLNNVEALGRALEKKPFFKVLDLADAGLVSVAPLAKAISANTHLRYLNLSGQAASDFIVLAHALKTSHLSMDTFYADKNNLHDEEMVALGELLSASNIGVLSLNDNHCSNRGAMALAQAAQKSQQIPSLMLRNNNIGDEGLAALARAVDGARISQLDVSNQRNGGGNTGLRAIASALKSNPKNLFWLNISGYTDDTTEAISEIGEALKTNNYLQSLDLSGHTGANSDVAFTKLAEGLKHPGVLFLKLTNCNIGPKAVSAIASALAERPIWGRPLNLMLDKNPIGKESAAFLAQAIAANHELTWLSLVQTDLDDDAVISIADSLKHNSNLISLDLSGNNFFDKGVIALADALQNNFALQILNLGDLKLDDAGEKAMHEIYRILLRNSAAENKVTVQHSLSPFFERDNSVSSVLSVVTESQNSTVLRARL